MILFPPIQLLWGAGMMMTGEKIFFLENPEFQLKGEGVEHLFFYLFGS